MLYNNYVCCMKWLVCIISLFLQFNFCLGQKLKTDSLLNLLNITEDDSSKISLYLETAKFYQNTNLDKALFYYKKASDLSELLNLPFQKSESNRWIGVCFMLKGNYTEAIIHLEYALSILQHLEKNQAQQNTSTPKSAIYGNMGSVYYSRSSYAKALEYYFKALKMYQELSDEKGQAFIYGNIGLVYKEQLAYDKALLYFTKALNMDKANNNNSGVARHLSNIGAVFSEQLSFDKSLHYYFEALRIIEETRDRRLLAFTYSQIGSVYKNKKNYSEALKNFFNALAIYQELGNKRGIASNLSNIGELYIHTGNYDAAERYLLNALEISNIIGEIYFKKNTYSHLSVLYEKKGLHKEALKSYKLYVALKDSLQNEENQKALVQKEMQFEFDKKAAADSVITAKQMEIKNVELAKQQAELKVKRNQQYALFGGLFLVLVFAYFMYKRFRITQKQKTIIEEQKIIVDKKQQEILDSIRYAKRIQDCMLPKEKIIARNIKNAKNTLA